LKRPSSRKKTFSMTKPTLKRAKLVLTTGANSLGVMEREVDTGTELTKSTNTTHQGEAKLTSPANAHAAEVAEVVVFITIKEETSRRKMISRIQNSTLKMLTLEHQEIEEV